MTEEIKVKNVAHVVFEGFTTLDMYGPVQAFASCRVPDGDGGWLRHYNQFTVGVSSEAVKSGEGHRPWRITASRMRRISTFC